MARHDDWTGRSRSFTHNPQNKVDTDAKSSCGLKFDQLTRRVKVRRLLLTPFCCQRFWRWQFLDFIRLPPRSGAA